MEQYRRTILYESCRYLPRAYVMLMCFTKNINNAMLTHAVLNTYTSTKHTFPGISNITPTGKFVTL
jgi:hypothetical protein